MPVSSYAPEFLELFKLAAQEEQVVPLGNKKRAIRMRFRIHMLRRDMRRENHPLTLIANSVEFSITPEGNLRCTPADVSFLKELKSIGVTITIPRAPSTPASDAAPEQAEMGAILKEFLKT